MFLKSTDNLKIIYDQCTLQRGGKIKGIKGESKCRYCELKTTSSESGAPPKPAPSPVLVIIFIKGITEESKCRYCESNSTGKKVQDPIFVSLLIPPPLPPHLFLSPFPLPSFSPSQEYCIYSLLWIETSVSSLSSASHF